MQILTTRLSIPSLRPNLVPRLRLYQKLNQGLESGFILVSAPAGYGKSTLLSAWLSQVGYPAAWISLDEGDNDPARFLAYLEAALQKIEPSLTAVLPLAPPAAGASSLAAGASSPPAMEMLLTSLVNQLSQLARPFWLVLDDYHRIQNQTIHQMMRFLIEHRPLPLHLAISTRADPPLPLARLRARSQMTELRLADLRFSQPEIAEFLDRGMGLNLSDADLALLEASTEGWIAGLQMAGLSLQGRKDVSGFIRSFSGENRFVLDFLFEEVFQQQTAGLRNFLLQTSILEQLCASLCDAVTLREDSQAILEKLERNNLFLILLDEQRNWYRYHHLFRDLLHIRLMQTLPDSTALLHQRASAWYAAAHDLENAITHALAAPDFERAARLIEQIVHNLDKPNKQAALTLWLDKLPLETLHAHPWLCVYRAWGYYWIGRRGQEEEWLQTAEKIMAQTAREAVLAEGAPQTRHIQGYIAAVRSFVALADEDIPRALEMGQNALRLLPDDDYEMRCETAVALAGVHWALGDVVRSERAFALARTAGLKVSPTMAVPSTCYMGIQQVKQGRLSDAIATFSDGLRLATLPDGYETPVAGFPHVKLGDIWRERNDLALAWQHLNRGVAQCHRLAQPDVLADAYVCLGRYQLAVGNLPAAHDALDKAGQIAQQAKVDPFVLSWLDECRLKIWLAESDLDAVTLWLQKCGLLPDEPFNYLHDLHHQNLARALVIQGILSPSIPASAPAAPLLARLQMAAVRAGWVHEEIKILVLQALHAQALGKSAAARQSLASALVRSAPGGYVRVFIDEGQVIKDLLITSAESWQNEPGDTLAQSGGELREEQIAGIHRYIARLIAEFAKPIRQTEPTTPAPPALADPSRSAPPAPTPPAAMVEPLSAREMEVLRLLAQGDADKKIAETLIIARETVHKHLKNIYGKLGVHSRTAAIARARDLGLL